MPAKFCIWVVSPPNYIHSQCFSEVAVSLRSAFSVLGYKAPIVKDPVDISGIPIVLGGNLLPAIDPLLIPEDTVIFNLEQIEPGSVWLTQKYVNILRKFKVWDYSPYNIQMLNKIGIKSAVQCNIGYMPELTHIKPVQEDIDVLFIGSINDRRKKILNGISAKGINIVELFGSYGAHRNQFIARAKMIINIHFYEAKVMEIVRISFLLANKKCVLCETSGDKSEQEPFRGGIVFAHYDQLVDECESYLKDDQKRKDTAEIGFNIFSGMSQADYLKNALEKSGLV